MFIVNSDEFDIMALTKQKHKKEKVGQIMSVQLHTISQANSLKEADLLFAKHHVRHLPVLDGNKLTGMLSLTDLQRISFVNYFSENEKTISSVIYEMLSIEQIMTRNITTVSSSDSIRKVAKILSNENFHALPVVDNDKLVGIVTSTDLLNYLLKFC